MFFSEFERPHFHALYAEYSAQVSIENLEIMAGDLPARAYRLVKEWAQDHQKELFEMYNSKLIHKLNPLE